MKFGFVGLGTMGGPMAGHLAKAGFPLAVWNRTPGKAGDLTEAESLESLGAGCDIVCLCVNRTEDVKECLTKLTERAKPGTLFIDHSTIAPKGALDIHDELKPKGFRFIDAPITGGSMGAQKGTLTIFCGGSEADVEEAKPYLAAYGKRVERVGGPGAGQMMKMANQIAVGGALLALCESMAFAKKAGLDLAQTRELLMGGAAGSWAFENYGPKILNEDWTPGFSIKNQRKDFAYCLDAGEDVGVSLPCTKLTDDLLKILHDEGRGEDASALLYELMIR